MLLRAAGVSAEAAAGVLVAVFGGGADDDVEAGLELAGFGIFDGFERDDDGVAFGLGFEDAERAVFFVERVAFDVALGGEHALVPLDDGHVDVWGARAVGDGFDGAEVVAAFGVGEEAAEALEIFVAFVAVATAAGVDVAAVGVGFPGFDDGVADGFAFDVADGAGEVGDIADGGGDAVVDDEEVVVGVEREFVRVERALGLEGCLEEGFGEGALGGEEGSGAEGGFDEEATAVADGAGGWCVFHGWIGIVSDEEPGGEAGVAEMVLKRGGWCER